MTILLRLPALVALALGVAAEPQKPKPADKGAAPAQPAPVAAKTPGVIAVERASASLAAAKKALAAGKKDEAIVPLKLLLAADPTAIETLTLLGDATAEDNDARTFWSHALATALAAPNGAPALDAAMKKRFASDPRPVQLATARSAAVDELVKYAREREKDAATHPDALLVAAWARRTALDLAQRSPAITSALAGDLSPRVTIPESLPTRVVHAIESFGQNALRNARTSEAIEAARILAGLATQLGWVDDLQGPRPSNLGSLAKTSAELLAKARAQLAAKDDRPWTIEELEALDADQAEAFTRAHASFGNPGVATSPKGWYRVETDCGFETLLGTAKTIEQHHARLARWYGVDPFASRPGLVRIVPEASGLEAEGAPFWWAGGFQGGDTTTLRFSCGGGYPSIEGLGHGITHELTHRFDGAVFPGLPAWLMEGKAVWTGAAFGSAAAESFVENYASLGTIEAAFVKGYGDPTKLTELIEGTIDDYRDNYVAGNALYVYLRSRKSPSGRLLFRDPLLEFSKRARGVKKWKEHFVACFCDGRDERPKSFEDLCADWTPWVAGFYWQDRKPWALEFTEEVGGLAGPMVLDEPVWTFSRARAEPRFGQDEAVLAGDLLLAAGNRADAIASFTWALAVDGRRPETEAKLAKALEQESRKDAAWCLKVATEGARAGDPPFRGLLPRTFAFAEALASAASDATTRALPLTSASLRGDRERLASSLGLAPIATDVVVDASAANVVFDGGSSPLAPRGWTESGLTGYEERRQKGRWCVDDEGNLVVGRAEPRAKKIATGGGIAAVDRAAAQVDCFALAPEWILPGSWRLDCTIRFQTSFVSGAVVLGYVERDDNVRFSFSAGDFNYAIGASEKQEHDFKELGGWLGGLRDRDAGLLGGSAGGSVSFDAPRSSFALSLVVDGPYVQAFVEGRPIGRYHTVDGAPIEGKIGFATSMGVMQVEDARVTRFDRSRLVRARGLEPIAFDLDAPSSPMPWEAEHHPSVGLPRRAQGTIVCWVAPPDKPLDDALSSSQYVAKAQRGLRELGVFLQREQPTQPVIVALPASLEESSRKTLEDDAKRAAGQQVELRTHAHRAEEPTDAADPKAAAVPSSARRGAWLLFVDGGGAVRAAGRLVGSKPNGEEAFLRWVHVFREHGRPPRTLPSFERAHVDPAGPSAPR